MEHEVNYWERKCQRKKPYEPTYVLNWKKRIVAYADLFRSLVILRCNSEILEIKHKVMDRNYVREPKVRRGGSCWDCGIVSSDRGRWEFLLRPIKSIVACESWIAIFIKNLTYHKGWRGLKGWVRPISITPSIRVTQSTTRSERGTAMRNKRGGYLSGCGIH